MNKKYTLALIALCSMGGTYAQSLTQAKQWFEEGKFAVSQPGLDKLLFAVGGGGFSDFGYTGVGWGNMAW